MIGSVGYSIRSLEERRCFEWWTCIRAFYMIIMLIIIVMMITIMVMIIIIIMTASSRLNICDHLLHFQLCGPPPILPYKLSLAKTDNVLKYTTISNSIIYKREREREDSVEINIFINISFFSISVTPCTMQHQHHTLNVVTNPRRRSERYAV